ncbi:MAG: hypothetical protein R3C69_02920 [Geminicoccaceae bacterium]
MDKLERAIGEREGAVVELTRELVAFPTVNPPGEAYAPCAEHLGRRRRQRLRGRLHPGRGGAGRQRSLSPDQCRRPLRDGRPGPTIHFNGHLDVVEVGQGWTVDPLPASPATDGSTGAAPAT